MDLEAVESDGEDEETDDEGQGGEIDEEEQQQRGGGDGCPPTPDRSATSTSLTHSPPAFSPPPPNQLAKRRRATRPESGEEDAHMRARSLSPSSASPIDKPRTAAEKRIDAPAATTTGVVASFGLHPGVHEQAIYHDDIIKSRRGTLTGPLESLRFDSPALSYMTFQGSDSEARGRGYQDPNESSSSSGSSGSTEKEERSGRFVQETDHRPWVDVMSQDMDKIRGVGENVSDSETTSSDSQRRVTPDASQETTQMVRNQFGPPYTQNSHSLSRSTRGGEGRDSSQQIASGYNASDSQATQRRAPSVASHSTQMVQTEKARNLSRSTGAREEGGKYPQQVPHDDHVSDSEPEYDGEKWYEAWTQLAGNTGAPLMTQPTKSTGSTSQARGDLDQRQSQDSQDLRTPSLPSQSQPRVQERKRYLSPAIATQEQSSQQQTSQSLLPRHQDEETVQDQNYEYGNFNSGPEDLSELPSSSVARTSIGATSSAHVRKTSWNNPSFGEQPTISSVSASAASSRRASPSTSSNATKPVRVRRTVQLSKTDPGNAPPL